MNKNYGIAISKMVMFVACVILLTLIPNQSASADQG